MDVEQGAGDGVGGVARPGVGHGQRGLGDCAGGEAAGVGAEQPGRAPRKAEAVEQRLKRRDAGMIQDGVPGVAQAGERAAETVVQGVARGQHHDAPPGPAQGEGLGGVLAGLRADDPGVLQRNRAGRQQGPRTVRRVRVAQQGQRSRVGGEADAARNHVDAARRARAPRVRVFKRRFSYPVGKVHLFAPCMK